MVLTLNEMCKQLGVTRRAIQGYEAAGLLKSSGKNKYGYLLYDETEIEKVRTVKQYRDFGFSVKEIKELQILSDEGYVDIMTNKVIEMRKAIVELKENIVKAESFIAERTKR